ncbi:aldehyde dehydrogenase [Nocardia sp. BSTN01]|uniref:aldehyde dehydrogenase family protein n=1 Tax=Nocardia sp. BSTN01 TaxID=2783665 RepID=UPI0018904E00|nr:aldehyde dehydrogenase family protein [Nocardia sp. BSTN01]MBF4997366.1 aldehyde dehydrogenase [Nocardia sp. BSTN01]
MAIADAAIEQLPPRALLIGDQEIVDTSGGEYQHVYAATGKPSATVPLAGRKEVDEAVAAARAALPGWKATPADQRRNLLLRMADLVEANAERLTAVNIVDTSTPMLVSAAQLSMTVDLLRYNAGWADKVGGEVHSTWPVPAIDYSLDEPYGVVGIIIPWNGPITSIGQILGPALAAGNCVVFKPSELAPFGALLMGRLFAEAGFPPGVVNVVPGGPDAGDAIVRHAGIDKVHFTGGGATARHILDATRDTLKPVGFELGGKSAMLVFDDANIDAAVGAAVAAVSINLSGQACITGSRILVQRSIYDDFVERTAQAAGQVPVGDPTDPTVTMGPVNNAGHCARILNTIRTAVDEKHGRLVAGGERLGGELADGFYIAPTVFADVDNGSSLAQQEVFGPVQTIIPFDTEKEAIAIANGTNYGLAAYIHTQEVGRVHRVAAALEAGNVWVNGGFGIPASVPFGGVKQSGYGRLGGIAGIREFSRPKNIWIGL